MANNLRDLTIDEVSIVDRPANSSIRDGKKVPHARIAIWKRDTDLAQAGGDGSSSKIPGTGETPMNLEAIEKKLTEQDAAITALRDENNVLKAENELVLKMSKHERELYASMPEDTRKAFMAGDVTKRASLMEEAKKAQTTKTLVDAMDEVTKARYEKAGPAEREEILTTCTKKAKAFGGKETSEEEELETGEEEEEEEVEACDKKKVGKSDVVSLELARAQDRVSKTEGRLAKAEEELTVIRKRERLIRFTKRAESELPHTPGNPEEKGARLMKMAEVYGEDTPEFNEMLGVLKAADKALAIQFHEIGKAGGVIPAEKVWDNKVEEISKRDKIDKGHATAKAMEEAPELYLDYEVQQRHMVASR